MPRRTDATEQTRANLRQAFWELYARKPLERISVREITDRAGYNRATFYLHYHDVYELLNEIEDTVLGPWRASWRNGSSPSPRRTSRPTWE